MVLCAENFQIASDGRVSLTPMSLAVFGKARSDGGPVEISTISGLVAWLKFDRPVTNFSEMGGRKIIEAEVQGQIEINNNRRKAERDDDLHVSIANGPLYYREKDHLIWTNDHVRLTDFKSKPKPHVITGKGMTMELHTEKPEDSHAKRKAQKEAISGINWIVLHSTVVMELYMDGKNGLVPNTQPQGKPAAVKAGGIAQAPEKSRLDISCPGPFRYDIGKDHDVANYDAALPGPPQPMRNPQHVVVVRTNSKGERDHLICRHLTLTLRRKESGAGEKCLPRKKRRRAREWRSRRFMRSVPRTS